MDLFEDYSVCINIIFNSPPDTTSISKRSSIFHDVYVLDTSGRIVLMGTISYRSDLDIDDDYEPTTKTI